MTLGDCVLVAVLFTTFAVFQLLWDGQFLTYQMFGWVHERSEQVFVHVHQTYAKNLWLPTYLPILAYLLSSGALLFARPAWIPLGVPVFINLLNLLAVISTVVLLVPIHIRIDRDEKATIRDVHLLQRYNLIRFTLVSVNALLLLWLMAQRLGHG
jgi:hypothetical protein